MLRERIQNGAPRGMGRCPQGKTFGLDGRGSSIEFSLLSIIGKLLNERLMQLTQGRGAARAFESPLF